MIAVVADARLAPEQRAGVVDALRSGLEAACGPVTVVCTLAELSSAPTLAQSAAPPGNVAPIGLVSEFGSAGEFGSVGEFGSAGRMGATDRIGSVDADGPSRSDDATGPVGPAMLALDTDLPAQVLAEAVAAASAVVLLVGAVHDALGASLDAMPGDVMPGRASHQQGILAFDAAVPHLLLSLLNSLGSGVLAVAVGTSDALDALRAHAERVGHAPLRCRTVQTDATATGRRARRVLQRLGRTLAAPACAPQRLDRTHSGIRRKGAARAALDALEALLSAPDVEEFQIRGGESMVVEYAGGRKERRSSPFSDDDALIEAVRFMAAYSGDRPQRFDELDPRLDIRVGERWRLHAEAFVTSPPNVVLRSNLAGRMQLSDLGLVSAALGSILTEAIAGRCRANVVVAASMGGGKTTLCQALLAAVPAHERIDTIEDTPELRLADYGIHPNAYERLTRDPNQDGHGRHSMADHIRDAKRSNASKLVVGEIRGEGCEALLDAMSSGIDGCLVTLHSQPGKGVLEKLVAYACSEGAEPDYARRQIAAAVDLCVWMGRNEAGQRVVADVTQLTGIDESSGVIATTCLWALQPGERWAAPVGRPTGRVAAVYESAGVSVAGLPVGAFAEDAATAPDDPHAFGAAADAHSDARSAGIVDEMVPVVVGQGSVGPAAGFGHQIVDEMVPVVVGQGSAGSVAGFGHQIVDEMVPVVVGQGSVGPAAGFEHQIADEMMPMAARQAA